MLNRKAGFLRTGNLELKVAVGQMLAINHCFYNINIIILNLK